MRRSFDSRWVTRIRSPRWRLGSVTSAAALLLVALFGVLELGAGVERRQAILVIVDAARQDAFGCYGHPDSPTPHFDRVAAGGVRFDQAIAPSGWTLPSVASILTGSLPTVHGGCGVGGYLLPIREEVPTGAEVLGGAGVHTMGFANAAFFSPMLGLDRGFDSFDHLYTFNGNYRRADRTVDAALRALRKYRTRRNFVVVHLFDPHLDYGAPEPFTFRHTRGRTEPRPPLKSKVCEELGDPRRRDPSRAGDVRYVRDVYEGEVSFIDAQVGRLVEGLRSLGMYDDSLLILTADHGEEFWEHGGFEHGHSLYDELIRVPLVVKYPVEVVPARRVVESQVRLVDVLPTVFEWFGVERAPALAGESLTPLVTGGASGDREAYSEGILYGPKRIALRGARYKCILTLEGDRVAGEELYDWREDPGETRNLAAERPGPLAEHRERLLATHRRLEERASRMSRPEPIDLTPARVGMLRALGYLK